MSIIDLRSDIEKIHMRTIAGVSSSGKFCVIFQATKIPNTKIPIFQATHKRDFTKRLKISIFKAKQYFIIH